MKFKKFVIVLLLAQLSLTSCLTTLIRESDTSDTFKKCNFNDQLRYHDILLTDYELYIPVFLKGYRDTLYMQLDIGTSQTLLYEKEMTILMSQGFLEKSKIIKQNDKHYYKDAVVFLGEHEYISADKLRLYQYPNAPKGYQIDNDSLAKNYKVDDKKMVIGTLGYDFICDKMIVIDFQNKRYALTDKRSYKSFPGFDFVRGASCDLSPVILKIKFGRKKYRVKYDTGSSAWDLILKKRAWMGLQSKSMDTIKNVGAWGKNYHMYHKIISEPLQLGSLSSNDIDVYYYDRFEDPNMKLGFIILNIDGLIGNSLFYNETVLIDTRNNKFGIKENKN